MIAPLLVIAAGLLTGASGSLGPTAGVSFTVPLALGLNLQTSSGNAYVLPAAKATFTLASTPVGLSWVSLSKAKISTTCPFVLGFNLANLLGGYTISADATSFAFNFAPSLSDYQLTAISSGIGYTTFPAALSSSATGTPSGGAGDYPTKKKKKQVIRVNGRAIETDLPAAAVLDNMNAELAQEEERKKRDEEDVEFLLLHL